MARMGTMKTKKINSSYLQEEMTVKVYLPKEFNPIYAHEICYMQDGDDYFQMGRIATLSDTLHGEDVLVNTVFVGIHYVDRPDRLRKYHPDGKAFTAYQQFLVEEVMPYVEELLPLNPLGKTNCLIGDSLAGTFALVTAMDYPTLFPKVIMQSPLADDTVFQHVQAADSINQLSIYHSIGLDETAVETSLGYTVDFTATNDSLAAIIREEAADYIYERIENGNHTWKYWQKEMPDVLEKMLS